MNTIVYLLYGSKSEYHLELNYSVLSAWKHLAHDPNNTKIALVCDRKNQRNDLPIECVVVSDELIHSWQMYGLYNHAAQAHCLKHALTIFGGNVLQVDTDTFFKRHPSFAFSRISKSCGVMHTREGRLLEDVGQISLWNLLLKSSTGIISGHPFDLNIEMYNAGCIGMNEADLGLLDDVISYMEEVRNQNSVFTAVQLATSVVLKKNLTLSVCDDIIDHYWAKARGYYHYQIAEFIDTNKNVALSELAPRLPVLNEMPAYSKFDSALCRTLAFVRGDSESYSFARLAYRSAIRNMSNMELSKVWAEICVNVLIYGVHPSVTIRQSDFKYFAPNDLEKAICMNGSTREKWETLWKRQGVAK